MKDMKTHNLSPTERLVMKQSGFTTLPLRQQAHQLMSQANAHEMNAAVDILQAVGLSGVVKALKRDAKGIIGAIAYQEGLPEQPLEDGSGLSQSEG